jgi:hypothetical protein
MISFSGPISVCQKATMGLCREFTGKALLCQEVPPGNQKSLAYLVLLMIFFSKNAAINSNPGFPFTNAGGARDGYKKTPFSKMRRGFFQVPT